MKKILLITLALATLVLTSCEKEKQGDSANSALIGTWAPDANCVSVNYELTGENITIPDFSGTGEEIIITKDQINMMLNQELLPKLNYSLREENLSFTITPSVNTTHNLSITMFNDNDVEATLTANDNGTSITLNIPFEEYNNSLITECTLDYTANNGKLVLTADKGQIVTAIGNFLTVQGNIENEEESAQMAILLIEYIAQQIESIEIKATFIQR